MTALLQRDESAIAYRPSDVLGRIDGNEVVIAMDDERRERRLLSLGSRPYPFDVCRFFGRVGVSRRWTARRARDSDAE
jgi:hypothetical protein